LANLTPDQESLGRRRFPDNKAFRQNLYSRTSILVNALYGLIPSNYPPSTSTNLADLFRILSREFSRIWYSSDAISADKQYTQTRPEYLQQILGERLFLGNRIAPVSYSDESFRKYLINLKDAYLKGSGVKNIEDTIKNLVGPQVRIKELYKEARKPNSAYDVSDGNMMLLEMTVEEAYFQGINVATLVDQLDFFVKLVKPAHVLYDTRIIWADTIDINKVVDIIYGDTGGGCVPVYDVIPFSEKVVLALQVFVSVQEGASGRIGTIHEDDKIFYLEDNTLVITDPDPETGTLFFDTNGGQLFFEDLRIGMYVSLNALRIPGDFQFWYLYPSIGTGFDRFYRSTFRKPIFQEFVKKEMDSKGRFPLQVRSSETTLCDRWVSDLLFPYYEDLRRSCRDFPVINKTFSTTLSERMQSPRLSWQDDDVTDPWLLGSSFSFMLENVPVTPTPEVTFDGTSMTNSVSSLDSSTGQLDLVSNRDYWDSSAHYPIPGEVFRFEYTYLLDGTVYDSTTDRVYGIAAWQMPSVPMTDGSGSLADTSDLSLSVDGTSIQGAVTEIRPLQGHVRLNDTTSFWLDSIGRLPYVGDEFRFSYKYGGYSRYAMIFDDPERVFDTISPLTMVFDGGSVIESDGTIVYGESLIGSGTTISGGALGSGDETAVSRRGMPYEDLSKIGYRYRANQLHHASVLNSPDTLTFNDYQKPVFRASLANQQGALNHMNWFFSPEFLYDTSSFELNDRYLDNGLDPQLELYEGTPTFQETFSYHPQLVNHRKLINIRQHRAPLMYSSLLLKEFGDGEQSIPLSPLCDNSPLGFRIRFREELSPISECDPWVYFDYADTTSVMVTIPGLVTGEPNLRVPEYLLRYNFMLRDRSDLGIGEMTYSSHVYCTAKQIFQLPDTVPIETDLYGTVDFPSLPVLHDATTLATTADVQVSVDGTSTFLTYLDPVTGNVVTDATVQPGSSVSFSYIIADRQMVDVSHPVSARLFDSEFDFGSACPDPVNMDATTQSTEYINFMDDYSSGIRKRYLNKTTHAVEERVFTGPVFELCDLSLDEFSPPECFPGALVPIPEGAWGGNPMSRPLSFDFTEDELVKFRKKTFKELLPDRTFRTVELVEMLAI